MHKKKIKKIIVEKFKYDTDDDGYTVKKFTIDDDEYHGLNICPKFILKLLIHARTANLSDAELTAVVDKMKWHNEKDPGVYIDDSYWEDLMAAAAAKPTTESKE